MCKIKCCNEPSLKIDLIKTTLVNTFEKIKNDCNFQKHSKNLKKCKNEKNYNALINFIVKFINCNVYDEISKHYCKKIRCEIVKLLKQRLQIIYYDDNNVNVYNSLFCHNTICNYINDKILYGDDLVGYYNKTFAKFTGRGLVVSTVTGSGIIGSGIIGCLTGNDGEI